MGLEKGFSLNMSVCKKYYFYTLSICVVLCEVSMVAWDAIVFQHVLSIDRIAFWKTSAIISLVTLFVTGGILATFTLFGGGFSVFFFNNEKFRTRSSVYNSCMVKVLKVLFLVTMIVQASVAISMLITTPTVEDDFKEAFKNYNSFRRTEDTDFVNDIQNKLNCCGIHSYRDYFGNEIPISCCSNILQPILKCTKEHVQLTQGCVFALNNAGFTLASKIYAISTFTLIITTLEFIGFVVTLCLVNTI